MDYTISTKLIVQELQRRFPDKSQFRTKEIVETAKSLGYGSGSYRPLTESNLRVKIGTYDLSGIIETTDIPQNGTTKENSKMQSIVNEDKTFATTDPTFVPWGSFHDIVKIIKSEMFYPVYVSGLSGNGKTFMVEQAAAKLKRIHQSSNQS